MLRKMVKFVRLKREDIKKTVLKWNQVVESQAGSGPGLFQEGRIDCFHAIPFRQRQAYIAFIYDIHHLQFLIDKADLERTRKKMHDSMKKRGHRADSYKKYSSDEYNDGQSIRGQDYLSSENRYASYRGRLRELLLGLKDRIIKARVQEAALWKQLETNAGHLAAHQSFKKSRKWSIMLEKGLEQSKKVKTEDLLTGKAVSKFTFNIEDNSLVALGLMLTTHWNPLKSQKSGAENSSDTNKQKGTDKQSEGKSNQTRKLQELGSQSKLPASKASKSTTPGKTTPSVNSTGLAKK